MSLAEKFQITVPYSQSGNGEKDGSWATTDAVRVNTGNPQPHHGEKFNMMPVGYDATSEKDAFVQGFGGDTDVTGQTTDLRGETLVKGYKRRDMKATDDQYSGEHCDHFYGEAVDEKGQVGFAERNNYLDRN